MPATILMPADRGRGLVLGHAALFDRSREHLLDEIRAPPRPHPARLSVISTFMPPADGHLCDAAAHGAGTHHPDGQIRAGSDRSSSWGILILVGSDDAPGGRRPGKARCAGTPPVLHAARRRAKDGDYVKLVPADTEQGGSYLRPAPRVRLYTTPLRWNRTDLGVAVAVLAQYLVGFRAEVRRRAAHLERRARES